MRDFKNYFENIVDLSDVQEIRLRADKPLCVIKKGKACFLDKNGNETTGKTAISMDKYEIEEIFLKLCKYSVHAYKNELKEGFLTTEQGHRVGIGGFFHGKNFSAENVTSLNIRLAKEYPDCSKSISDRFFSEKVKSIIIIGEPSSGKTTLLRDLAVKLTEGGFNKSYKVAVIDSRNEICGYNRGKYTFDVGINTDVITGIPKAEGIMQAVRVLSPDIIICDEMGSMEDTEAVRLCLNSGVELITTVHAADEEEILRKPQIKMLLNSGAFKYAVLLEGAENPTKVKRFGEVKYIENIGNNFNSGSSIIIWDK